MSAAAVMRPAVSPVSPALGLDSHHSRPLRPRPNSASSIPHTLHHQLLSVGQRSRSQDAAPHEFHDAVLRADTARKSIRSFKGHAKGILRHLFFALLVRFFVIAAIAIGLVGSAAWFFWSHRKSDSFSGFRSNFSLFPPSS